MKHKNFFLKIYLFGILFIVFCGIIYLGIAKSFTDSENTDAILYAEDSTQRQWNLAKIEVQKAVCDYNQNIEGVFVYLETSDNQITSANILVVSKDKITDADEQDKIKTIASECLCLDAQNVCITYEDGKTFSTQSKSGDAIAIIDENFIQRQGHLKEIEVKQALSDYDKKNIEQVSVYVETSDNEITSANILVVSKDKITDVDEQDKIKAIALEHLNLNAQNVSIEYKDSKAFSNRKEDCIDIMQEK